MALLQGDLGEEGGNYYQRELISGMTGRGRLSTRRKTSMPTRDQTNPGRETLVLPQAFKVIQK